MADTTKDTIYIDADDEITSIIDKVQSSKHKIAALVLPKRSTVMQSAVNMKLLKSKSDDAKKKVVLITSEAGVLALAGVVGVHVARTLQSKPEIPARPEPSDVTATLSDTVTDTGDGDVDASKSVGELAGMDDAPSPNSEEVIDIDNSTPEPEVPASDAKSKKLKKIKIPDFNRFRLRLILGALLLIALIGGWIAANIILPKATIAITTDTTVVNSEINFTANTEAEEVDTEKSIVPAVSVEHEATDSVTVAATGKKNVGKKAEGTMTVTNCIDDGEEKTVPAGTRFTSGQYTFVTTEAVTLEPALYSGGNCVSDTFGLSEDADVEAATGGTSHNVGERSYNSSINGITGYGSEMEGGTDKEVSVVAQSDIDKAKEQLADAGKDDAEGELADKVAAQDMIAIDATLQSGKQSISASPALGTESENVTVTATTKFTMLGVSEDDLKKLIENSVKDQIDLNNQSISDYGINDAAYEYESKRSANDQSVSSDFVVTAGAQIDEAALKQEITGKKSGEVKNLISSRPGVKDVSVEYSPFWRTTAPKPEKITITFIHNGPSADDSQ